MTDDPRPNRRTRGGDARTLTLLAKAWLAVGSIVLLFTHTGLLEWCVVNAVAVLAVLWSLRLSGTVNRLPKPVVEGERVRMGDHVVRIEDVTAAYTDFDNVEIEMKNGDHYSVRCPAVDDANALVAELGFDDRRRIDVPLGEPGLMRMGFGMILYALAAGALHLVVSPDKLAPSSGLLALAIYEMIRWFLAKDIYSFGSDGIFRDGKRVELDALIERENIDRWRRDALVRRWRRGHSTTPPEQRARFRVSLEETVPFRATSRPAEDALAVLQSRDATAEERLNAAKALRVVGDVAQIRIAASEIVDPQLRGDLEEIARVEPGKTRR